MSERRVKFTENHSVVPCKKCGNKTEFTIISRQFAEDCCEVWAQCKCGYEHASQNRFEDVWGGVNDGNVMRAIDCWNSVEGDE